MKSVDVWFCRYEGNLFYVLTDPGEAPDSVPKLSGSVARVYGLLRKYEFKVTQVGIVPPDMLGLE